MITPVILCGGSGTRLWPLSRELYPKQLLALTGEQSLLQQTVLRLAGIAGIARPLVLCNEEHRFLIAEQLRQVDVHPIAIILEPEGRNTAPAVALAALHITATQHDSAMLVLPADHCIEDIDTFQRSVEAAASLADTDGLVTFGIVPKSPETGYGYIKRGESHCQTCAFPSYPIEKFVEKPDSQTAAVYVADGNYFWNSGMFVLKGSTFLAELEKYAPRIYQQCRLAYEQSRIDLDFIRVDKSEFAKCPSDSIDYAVMERTTKGIIIPVDFGWNDIGSWSALWDIGEKDDQGNAQYGDVLLHDTRNSYIHADSRLVTTIGMENCVVVETADAVMVANKDNVQDVKQIVSHLRAHRREEANTHRCVYRPWGSYESMVLGDRFQVKLITVKPGAILSL